MLDSAVTTSVVVAIDGSASAVDAALWAVDEALDRDVPLRFVYVIEPARPDVADSQEIARRLATAEVAVRYAVTAVESSETPVKMEVEILQGPVVPTLLEASRSAALLCVGARATPPKGASGRPPPRWRLRHAAPWPSSALIGRTAPANARWSSRSTTTPPAARCCSAVWRRRGVVMRRCGS